MRASGLWYAPMRRLLYFLWSGLVLARLNYLLVTRVAHVVAACISHP